jgi:mannose-6-phosphate isomerase-like protein (cupin superfamily)
LWYFLDNAVVQLGNKKIKVKQGKSIRIPRKKAHRIISEKSKIRVLEISFGDFREGDEIRREDKYGRK